MRHGIWVAIAAGAVAGVCPGMASAQVEHIDVATGFTQVVTSTDQGVKTIFVSGHRSDGATI